MVGSSYGDVAIKLFILLAMCCGVEADCGNLTVYHENKVINTDSVCLRRYRTPACERFVYTFNQSDLPEGFPRNDESVDRPAYLNIKGQAIVNKKTVYSGLSVKWASPLSGTSRRNCFGYLLVWYVDPSKKLCQLFQLNQTDETLSKELHFEYFISKVQSASTYTVEVYSMPPFLHNFKDNKETYRNMLIVTPTDQQISSMGMEPTTWAPFITYLIFDNGTFDGTFTLPPPSMNITRFNILLANHLDDNMPLYDEDYRLQDYPEQTAQGVLKFILSDTGCYKMVIWGRDEEEFRNIPGKCRCWRYEKGARVCENLCGGIYINFCLNVTRPPDAETTETQVNRSVNAPSVSYSSLKQASFQHIPVAIAGALVGSLLFLALAFLLVYSYRNNYTVKWLVNRMNYLLHSKPRPIFPIIKPDELTAISVLAPLTQKTVYIMYADDHEPHLQLVESFSLFLEMHCHCKVMTPSRCDDYGSGIYEWFVSNINRADYIIFINSEGAENLIVAYLNNKSYNARRSTTVEDAFHYGLKHLMINEEARERNVILVSFQGKHCQKYLQAAEIHMLPQHLPHLLRRIHNLNAKSAMAYSYSLPMQIENLPKLPEGIQLLSAIKNIKDYEEHNPDWFEKIFGTIILSSSDSECSSTLHNGTMSVSTQDLTFSETTSPVSVLEQPNFARCLDTSTLLNSSRPKALPYSRYLGHTQNCDGNYICELEKNLLDTNTCTDSEKPYEKLSILTIYEPHFNDLSKLKRDEIKHETCTLDEMSIVPPEQIPEIVFDSCSVAFDKINNNEELIRQYGQIPPNCYDVMYHKLEIVEPMSIAEVTPPDTISSIEVDSISSALLAINANADNIFLAEMKW